MSVSSPSSFFNHCLSFLLSSATHLFSFVPLFSSAQESRERVRVMPLCLALLPNSPILNHSPPFFAQSSRERGEVRKNEIRSDGESGCLDSMLKVMLAIYQALTKNVVVTKRLVFYTLTSFFLAFENSLPNLNIGRLSPTLRLIFHTQRV